ncbi:probable protein phosphatase 2C 68 [Sesamum indicum]|uniref:protein-serine/threonine phosphatase n=1 Tax=Sesamum indicum TaxID=4182 RepID=A0A6I9SWT1_SESIN|nr:probable protein phosphatase 2C 68 [Sesamum indicum]XP_011075136.1 probable protein phosphatase 2C 68 [Sesamum indicum]XP_011075138.1 probable protein phosphatase 2C 68 [Sesamum indicum]XP_020549064.1 probable protein phosphatase 2C 68 [Sesamum indicum]XP_020549065.1 probable protein phosphatase 2C 68 [Sesamum indicum]
MFSWLGRTASSCLSPLSQYARMNKDDEEDLGGENDALLWSKDLEKHSHGEFSFAVVQANAVLEDQSQVETGRHATFVGVYDGHGGPDASRYISDHLFGHLLRLAREKGAMSEDVLRTAFSETENGFLTLVRRAYAIRPVIAATGSCCLVGVIWKKTLYVANVGDSRAVMGYLDRSNQIVAEQLTRDHNVSMEEVRKELRNLHPEDSEIVVMKQGVWRIKGIIQVSRSIGDAYLKRPEFSLDPSFPRFHLPEPLHRPVLRADPTIVTRDLQPNYKFLIFASDGLWEYLTNQEAVELVYNSPRVGIARRLLIWAMEKAAKTRQMPYSEIKKLDQGVRRHVHDDITIVIIFIDHEMLDSKTSIPELSVRGFVDTVGPSNFNFP